jgi:hypothetical protein
MVCARCFAFGGLLVGGWWLVVGGWWLVVGRSRGCRRMLFFSSSTFHTVDSSPSRSVPLMFCSLVHEDVCWFNQARHAPKHLATHRCSAWSRASDCALSWFLANFQDAIRFRHPPYLLVLSNFFGLSTAERCMTKRGCGRLLALNSVQRPALCANMTTQHESL